MYPNEENPINPLIDALEVEAVESQFSEPQVEELSFSETVKAMVASANASVPDARKVMPIEAMTVAHRSLSRTIMSQDAQARAFTALREVSDYINMATTGNPAKMSSHNTDLLSIGHPLSTSTESISLIEKIEKRSEWFAADPRISEEYRPVVASAYLTVPDTVERQFSIARLESADAQDVPREVVLAIIAAGNPFSGENSFLARSARAKLQRRDRRGRFAWMGGGARFFTKGLKGFIDSVVGKFVGSDPKTNTFDVEVFDHPTLGTGIFRIPATNVEGVKAYIGGKLGKMLALKGKRSADYARDYALDVNSLQKIDAPSGWTAAGNGFTSADGYYAINHAAGAELPDLQRHIDTYGAEVKGLGENGAIDPKYPVYEVMTNPLSQPDGRFAEGGNQSIGYYQSWGDVQAGVSRYDRKNDQKRSGAVQKRMWGDVPQGEFPKNTFEQVTPADPEKGLPYSTYRSTNNAKNLGGFTVRRYQPEQHKAVQSRMEENVKNGAVVNGFRSGSSEIEDDQPIFEVTRQVAPWEDKNIQPEVIGYAQDWEDVQALAENNETTSPRQPNPRDKKVRAFKAKASLDHVHDDDVISPEDFTKQEDGSYATKPSSDEALRATVRENAQGKWVAEVYNDKASQESFDPASRRTYNNPEDAIENAAEWMTEENDSRSDRPKTEAQLREERNGQMLYSGDPKATLPEDLGEPNSPEAKEALAKVGIDLQTPEKPAENKSATDLADELDSMVPQFLVSPEVVGKNRRTLAVGKTMMANIKRWAGVERGTYQFQEIKRPDDSVLDEIDNFVEKSKELTAAARARIAQRMKEKHGDNIFEKLANIASANQEQRRLTAECHAEARKIAEQTWQQKKLEQEAVNSALEQSYIKNLYDPVIKNREIQKYVEGYKERFIQNEVKVLTTRGSAERQPLEQIAFDQGNQKILDLFRRRREIFDYSRLQEDAAKDLGIIAREEYQQLLKDLDIPMYDGDGSDFIDFSGIRRTSVPDKKMSDSVDAAKESVEWALRSYPAAIVERIKDYVQKNSDNGKLKVIWSPTGRGYFEAGTNTLALSYELRDPNYDIPIGGSVGVHEFGHVFEQAFPELKSMEWGFLFSQGLPKNEDGSRPNQMDSSADRNALPIDVTTDSLAYREVEIAIPDMFREVYSGRIYYRERDLDLQINPDAPYEIFTTGTESVLSAKHDVRFINNPKVIEAYENGELSAEEMLLDSNNSAFTFGVLVSAARSDKKSDSSLKPEDNTIALAPPIADPDLYQQIENVEEEIATPEDFEYKKAMDAINRAAEIANGIKNPKAAEAAKKRVETLRYKLSEVLQNLAPADALFRRDLNADSDKEIVTKNQEVLKRLKKVDSSRTVGRNLLQGDSITTKSNTFEYETADGEKFTIQIETNRRKTAFREKYLIPPDVTIFDSEGKRVGIMQVSVHEKGTDPKRYVKESDVSLVNPNKPFSTIFGVYIADKNSRRKGVATAALEAVRQSTNIPIYHSKSLTEDGRAFADAVQSSVMEIEEDLGVTDLPNTLVSNDLGVASKRIASRKAMEVVSRLTNKQQGEKVTDYPSSTHTDKFTNFDYTTQDGEKFTISFSETNVHEKNPEFELGDYTLSPMVRVYDSEGDVVGSLAITRWDAGTDPRGLAKLSPTDEFDINQPFSTIGTIYVDGRHQRKGVATAMLESARDAMDVPVYHSPNLTANGRAFSDAVQSSATVVEEDLGVANANDSDKAREVKSRLTKADTPARPLVSDDVDYIEQDYNYKDPEGNDYVITHRRPALRQADAIAQNKYQVVDHFAYVTDPKTGKMIGDMNYYMYPANYEFAKYEIAEFNIDQLDSSKPFYTISGIAVNHEYKRRGLATAMLEAARSDTDFPIYHSSQLSNEGANFASAVQSPAQVLDEDLGDVRERTARSDAESLPTNRSRIIAISQQRKMSQEETKSRIKSNGDLETKFRDLDLSSPWVSKNFPKERIVTETGEYTLKNGMKIGLSRHDRWSIDTEGREYLTGGSVEAHLIEDGEMDAYPVGSFYYSEVKSYPSGEDGEIVWDITEVGGSSEQLEIDETSPLATVDWVEVDDAIQREGVATAMMEFARSNAGMPVLHDQTRTPAGTGFSEAVQSSPSEVLEQEDLGTPNSESDASLPEKQAEVRKRIKYDNNLEETRQGDAYKTVTETADYTTPDGRKVQLFREDFWITDEDSGDELSGGEVTVYAYDKDGNLDESAPIGQISYSEVGYEPFGYKNRIYDTSEIGGSSAGREDINPFNPFATIDMIEVGEKYQRQGIATAVLDFARKNAGMPIYHSHILTPDGKGFSNKVQSAETPQEEDLGTPAKKKIEIPPLAPQPKIEKGRDPKALEAAKKVRKLAEQMEPEVTKIMTTLAELLGGDLDQLDQRLKSTDSLARKIKDDADKEHKGDIEKAADSVSDSVRYTMTVDGSRYTDSVRKVIARFEAMGYEVRVKNFWEGGDPYQGINMKLTKNGVTVEFQMHTPESLQIKVDQLHDIYDVYREINTNEGQDLDKLERKEQLWQQMIGIASQIPNPDNYDELLNIGTLVQQQFEL